MGMQDSGRDARGRFTKGTSGNPGGRPRKEVHPPGDLDFRLAKELARQTRWTDADGTQRKGTRFEAIAARIIDEAEQAKPKEALALLERLKALGAIDIAQLLVFRDADDFLRFRRQQDESRKLKRAIEEIDSGGPLSVEAIEFLRQLLLPDDLRA
ncbi:DUF5681 domain-containing protein [Aurantiacibacter hainanensis]|uniref:DUF5681 domain-containing protein n=1 Tax=Aurantiacibacter hainanensis TaxID=3076114 RepID=UPI0030C6FF8E